MTKMLNINFSIASFLHLLKKEAREKVEVAKAVKRAVKVEKVKVVARAKVEKVKVEAARATAARVEKERVRVIVARAEDNHEYVSGALYV